MSVKSIDGISEYIRSFLEGHEYIIPEYQRPYSWTKDESLQLIDDLYDNYRFCEENNGSNPPYFLGTVVIHPEGSKRVVIDGQQRLITLSLLVKSLYDQCKTYETLERMIYYVDKETSKVNKSKIKIEHKVLDRDEYKSLRNILTPHNNKDVNGSGKNSNYEKNYEALVSRINEFMNEPEYNFSADKMKSFIESILDRTLILPIKCEDTYSALTVFQTINNRGMSLKDTDIFKSLLHKSASQKNRQAEFTSRWNEIETLTKQYAQPFSLQDTFTNYMHILRGKDKITDSVVGIRKYFTEGNKNILENTDWDKTITSIEKIVYSWKYITDKSYGADDQIINWTRVLIQAPTKLWQYPVIAFLHKNIEGDKLDDFSIKTKNKNELKTLLKVIARFCYLRWLKHKSQIYLKQYVYRCVADIANGTDYRLGLQKSLEDISLEDLKYIIGENVSNKSKGICYLLAVLNDQQNVSIPVNEVMTIEHILPKKWNKYKYDGWEVESAKEIREKIGNLVLLERKYNISAGNDFFEEKKKNYEKSEITEAKELATLETWTYYEYTKRRDRIHGTLQKFFFPDN